jgi:hypothetical protein
MMLSNVPSARFLSWRLAPAPITARGMPRPLRHWLCGFPRARCAHPPLLFPEPEAIIHRCAGSPFPWQRIPLDDGTPHVHDG